MNTEIRTTATIVVAPEVLAFVATVRAQLADLEPDELMEITDGLEADLTDLVAERGIDALGDPVDYAAELRSAAGIEEGALRPRRPLRASVGALLDTGHQQSEALVARLPWDLVSLLTSLRPLWWVLRAWVAVQLVQLVFGQQPWSGTTLVPHLRGVGWLVLVAAVVISVQLGRRKLPGWHVGAGTGARVVMVGLNAGAVVLAPFVLSQLHEASDLSYVDGYAAGNRQGYADARVDFLIPTQRAGMYVDGKWVSQIYPYDAAGKPLVGVQLFNQVGKPLNVRTATECVYDNDDEIVEGAGRVYYPWSNGAAQANNAFPVPDRVQTGDNLSTDPTAFSGKRRPTVTGFPFGSVPRISLPGLAVSSTTTPSSAFVPGPRAGSIDLIGTNC